MVGNEGLHPPGADISSITKQVGFCSGALCKGGGTVGRRLSPQCLYSVDRGSATRSILDTRWRIHDWRRCVEKLQPRGPCKKRALRCSHRQLPAWCSGEPLP